jgi:hypothetical protein
VATPKRRKPLGQPLNRTEEEIDELLTVRPSDIKAALRLWQNEAPSHLRRLLEAAVQEEDIDGRAD